MILEGSEPLDLAAVVAYEHHRMLDGGGYPHVHYPRDCHQCAAAWCTSATCTTRYARAGPTARPGSRRGRWSTSRSGPAAEFDPAMAGHSSR